MKKKEWIRLALVVGVGILFIIVLLGVMSFTRKKENIDYTEEPSAPEEIKFTNASDMTESEIRELVEEKRTNLKNFFHDAQYYNIGDVSENHTSEDNDDYMVVNEDFLNELKTLLSSRAYDDYYQYMEEIEKRSDINIKGTLYMVPRDLFDRIYITSAIPSYDVSEEYLILESATNERIKARENIKLCNDEGICSRDDVYELDLVKEEDTWKVDEFLTLID